MPGIEKPMMMMTIWDYCGEPNCHCHVTKRTTMSSTNETESSEAE